MSFMSLLPLGPRKLGTVKCGSFEATIHTSGTVVYNGEEMPLSAFIKLTEAEVLFVQNPNIGTKKMASKYSKYCDTTKRNKHQHKPYHLWRSPKHLAVLGCVLAKKPLPSPANQNFVDCVDDLITELEDELKEKTSRPVSEVLQKYAVRAGAFYDQSMLEIQLEEQRKKKQKVEE